MWPKLVLPLPEVGQFWAFVPGPILAKGLL